jgi:tRNA-Thr(GGU) m(6)t(6)A37 methyltransferase TsaA
MSEMENSYEVRAIGKVQSSLTDLESAPKQGDEGAPEAWIVVDDDFVQALAGMRPGDQVIVLTWLHVARRDMLRVHPRGDPTRPQEGVFNTRSPHRPNPIGLHQVEVASIDGPRLRVRSLEAIDGTPVIDLKPALTGDVSLR